MSEHRKLEDNPPAVPQGAAQPAQDDFPIQTYLSTSDEEIQKRFVSFIMPTDATSDEVELATRIVALDHRSLRTLGKNSAQRAELRDLIVNVVSNLLGRQCQAASDLLRHTEVVYAQHIQALNRLLFFGGVCLGILLTIGFAVLLLTSRLFRFSTDEVSLLPLLFLFAGMGTATSVLTRFSAIDLTDQTSRWIVCISGIGKPLTGAFFSLVVYFILALRIVDINVGLEGNAGGPSVGIYLIAAFSCGFSERFALDILSRFGGGSDGK